MNITKHLIVTVFLLIGSSLTMNAQECEEELNLTIIDISPNEAVFGELTLTFNTGSQLTNLFSPGDDFLFEYSWQELRYAQIKHDGTINGYDDILPVCDFVLVLLLNNSTPEVQNKSGDVVAVVQSLTNTSITINNTEVYMDLAIRAEGSGNTYDYSENESHYPIDGCGNHDPVISTFTWIYDHEEDQYSIPSYWHVETAFQNALLRGVPINPLPLKIEMSSNDDCNLNFEILLDDPANDFMNACQLLTIREVSYQIIRTDINGSIISGKDYDLKLVGNKIFVGNFKLARAGDYEVSATVKYDCLDCSGEVSVASETSITVSEPSVNIVIDQSDQTTCTVNFNYDAVFSEDGCYVIRQEWLFGDGNTSSQQSPVHNYGVEGTYNGQLKIYYKCPSCSGEIDGVKIEPFIFDLPDLLSSQILTELSKERANVLSTGATTFNASWPVISLSSEIPLHPYQRGMAGVWRPEAGHVYNTSAIERTNSTSANLVMDGTYTAIDYNWKSKIPDAIPKWLKSNTVTGYNSESQEIENEDVLGVYSASVFGYGGNLPTVAGSNMANREMGFIGFEDMGLSPVSGNFLFGNEPIKVPTIAVVESGRSNILVVDAPIAEVTASFQEGDQVTVISRTHVTQTEILCIGTEDVSGTNIYPDKTIVILAERVNGSDEIYYNAKLIKETTYTGNSGTFDDSWAHSGEYSLRVNSISQVFIQPVFDLLPGETYSIYAWASAKSGDVFYPSPTIGSNIEIAVEMDGVNVGQAQLYGNIIEGWQQLRGNFTVPESGYENLQFSFKKGTESQVYFDDVRMFPIDGNMQGFVYDQQLRLSATLDENNYATFYSYDGENNLYLVRKETERGIKTIQQSYSNQKGTQ